MKKTLFSAFLLGALMLTNCNNTATAQITKGEMLKSCDKCWGLSEGLALFMKNDKWGYIDKTGKIVISVQDGGSDDFSEELARIAKNSKFGFTDKTGDKRQKKNNSTSFFFFYNSKYNNLKNI